MCILTQGRHLRILLRNELLQSSLPFPVPSKHFTEQQQFIRRHGYNTNKPHSYGSVNATGILPEMKTKTLPTPMLN